MGILEPGSQKLWKATHRSPTTQRDPLWKTVSQTPTAVILSFILVSLVSTQTATANIKDWTKHKLAEEHFSQPLQEALGKAGLNSLAQLFQTRTQGSLNSLLDRAEALIDEDLKNDTLIEDGTVSFRADSAVGDPYLTTIKFEQKFKGIDVIGNEARVHFNKSGQIEEVSGAPLKIVLDVKPKVSEREAYKILVSRFQNRFELSETPKLKIFKDFDGKPRLIYHMLTKTSTTHSGKEAYVDAHSGEVVLEHERAYHMYGNLTVFDGDTPEAKKYVDAHGTPTQINFDWYKKVIEDRRKSQKADRSAINAYQNALRVYHYYFTRFNRKSFDDKDTRITSVVHVGHKWANAFWTSEYQMMGYGDGDGEFFIDLTNGLDVAAHEMTHGVTSTTAKLVYAGEPGALNESYSDFFGKMVDYNEGNWDLGSKVMAPTAKRKALRNLRDPELYKQPGSNDSPLKKSIKGPCTRMNDMCGVHYNSGIPNRAAALIVESIGKEKAEQLYYHVLVHRLGAMSNFKDAREQTERSCKTMEKYTPIDCEAVRNAFDTVKM